MNRPILLDTCAAIWIAQSEPIAAAAEAAIENVHAEGGAILVSAISAWEVGLLVSRGRLSLSRDPARWFEDLLSFGVELVAACPDVLIASSFLPSCPLRDPADRIIAATARALNVRLMTRDAKLLDYAAAGHCSALPC